MLKFKDQQERDYKKSVAISIGSTVFQTVFTGVAQNVDWASNVVDATGYGAGIGAGKVPYTDRCVQSHVKNGSNCV